MISFFVDTSLSYIRIALFKDRKLIDYIDKYCDKDASILFDRYARELLTKNNLQFKDIDKIFAVTGPGSFTGIRIGLTFAKVLGMSIKKDIVPVSELEVLSSTNTKSKYIIPLIDARRGYVYTAMYDNQLNNIINDEYILLDEFLKKINENDVNYVSYNQFNNLNINKPQIDFEKLINKIYNRKATNYNLITPKYLKDTEAEENLKKKKLHDN